MVGFEPTQASLSDFESDSFTTRTHCHIAKKGFFRIVYLASWGNVSVMHSGVCSMFTVHTRVHKLVNYVNTARRYTWMWCSREMDRCCILSEWTACLAKIVPYRGH